MLVKKLQQAGAMLDASNKDGRTALMEAIDEGRVKKDEDVPKFLIESGADIHVEDKEGNTALTLAVKKFKEMKRSRFGFMTVVMEEVMRLLMYLDDEEVDDGGYVVTASSDKIMKKVCSILGEHQPPGYSASASSFRDVDDYDDYPRRYYYDSSGDEEYNHFYYDNHYYDSDNYYDSDF